MRTFVPFLIALFLMQSALAIAKMHLCQGPSGRDVCAGAGVFTDQNAPVHGTGSADGHAPSIHHHDCCNTPVANTLQETRLHQPKPCLPQAAQPPVSVLDVHFDIFHPPA